MDIARKTCQKLRMKITPQSLFRRDFGQWVHPQQKRGRRRLLKISESKLKKLKTWTRILDVSEKRRESEGLQHLCEHIHNAIPVIGLHRERLYIEIQISAVIVFNELSRIGDIVVWAWNMKTRTATTPLNQTATETQRLYCTFTTLRPKIPDSA